jgi:hypothetical protein
MVTPQQTISPLDEMKRTARENRTRTSLPDASRQEGASEAEAIETQANANAEEHIRVVSNTHFVHVSWDSSIFF